MIGLKEITGDNYKDCLEQLNEWFPQTETMVIISIESASCAKDSYTIAFHMKVWYWDD